MAFVVEDGTGIAGANALATVAFVKDYLAERGRAVAGGITDPMIEQWIIRATDYVTRRFGTSFSGTITTLTQSLPYPRTGVTALGRPVGANEIPLMLRQAIAEYADRVRVLGELMPDPPAPFDRTGASGATIAGGGVVAAKSEKVGPLSESVEYETGRATGTSAPGTGVIPAYPAVDTLIQPLLLGSGSNGGTYR